MTSLYRRAPWHLWPIGVIALLFNAIGVFDYVMNLAQGRAYLESAGMTATQIDHYRALPLWMMLAWGIGVIAAFAASALLLLRRRAATTVFAVALAAFLVTMAHSYLLSDGGAIMGGQMAITNVVIALLLASFAGYARAMTRRGVLR